MIHYAVDGAYYRQETVKQSELLAGESTIATATYNVTQAGLDKGEIVNVADVTGATSNDTLVTDKDSDKISAEKSIIGNILPKTATDMFTWMTIGLGSLILGVSTMLFARKRKQA